MLKSLRLQNFRNYSKRTFEFSDKTTLIVGPNAIGKTNVLEAIYLLATGRSFRAEEEKELVKEGESFFRVDGGLEEKEVSLMGLMGPMGPMRKIYQVNGVNRRQVDFVGNLRAVLFNPQDLEIVVNSPATRRKYLDLVLLQVHKDYRVAIGIYERALRQRNHLLRRIRDENLQFTIYNSQLEYWDRLLVENGKIIHERRKDFLSYLSHWSNSTNLVFPISLHYDHSIISEERLAKYREAEIGAGGTLVGPQRDGFVISQIRNFKSETRNRDVRLFGSRGEQRLAVFAIKLGELEYVNGQSLIINDQSGSKPILLLDDIFSELDHENRHHILEVIPKQQTIMTTTDLHLVEKEFLKHVEVVKLG